MQKTFPLQVAGKANARVIDAIKHDVRKYVKRERNKALPEGFEQWDFKCRVGRNALEAESTILKKIGEAIDTVAATNVGEIYVEIIAVPAHRGSSTPPLSADNP